MSMREYGVGEYGLLLDTEAMRELAKQMCPDYTDEQYDEFPYDYNETVEGRLSGIDYIGNFCGDAFAIRDDGTDDYHNVTSFNDEPVYLLLADNIPSLFNAAYSSIDKMVDEFRQKLENYLTDFEYKNHIVHLVGTYFG